MTANYSLCCSALVTVGGEGMTHYWVCLNCDKACDAVNAETRSSYWSDSFEKPRPPSPYPPAWAVVLVGIVMALCWMWL